MNTLGIIIGIVAAFVLLTFCASAIAVGNGDKEQ